MYWCSRCSGASLSSSVWPPSMKTVQPVHLNLQLDNGGGSSHPYPPLVCLKRWQSDHSAVILADSVSLLQKVRSNNGKPRLEYMSVVSLFLSKLLWMYCPGHAGVKGNDWADRLAGKASIISGLHLRRSEVLKSWKHYLLAHSAKDITRWIAWRREAWKEEAVLHGLPWILKGQEGHHQSDEHWNCFKGNVEETDKMGWSAYICYIMSFSKHIDTPSWTELNVVAAFKCFRIHVTSFL